MSKGCHEMKLRSERLHLNIQVDKVLIYIHTVQCMAVFLIMPIFSCILVSFFLSTESIVLLLLVSAHELLLHHSYPVLSDALKWGNFKVASGVRNYGIKVANEK